MWKPNLQILSESWDNGIGIKVPSCYKTAKKLCISLSNEFVIAMQYLKKKVKIKIGEDKCILRIAIVSIKDCCSHHPRIIVIRNDSSVRCLKKLHISCIIHMLNV